MAALALVLLIFTARFGYIVHYSDWGAYLALIFGWSGFICLLQTNIDQIRVHFRRPLGMDGGRSIQRGFFVLFRDRGQLVGGVVWSTGRGRFMDRQSLLRLLHRNAHLPTLLLI